MKHLARNFVALVMCCALILLLPVSSYATASDASHDATGIMRNEDYLIMNVNSGRYLFRVASGTESNGLKIQTMETNLAHSTAHWVMSERTDGTFEIVSSYSSTGKCFTASGGYVTLSTAIDAANQRFYINRVNSGIYQGTYYITYGSYYVAEIYENGQYYVKLSTTLTDACYWSFMAVEKGDASLYTFQTNDTITPPQKRVHTNLGVSTFETALYEYGTYAFCNGDAVEAYYNFIDYDDIFIFHGHGAMSKLVFTGIDGETSGHIFSVHLMHLLTDPTLTTECTEIRAIEDNGLASARMVLYLGCNTATKNDREGWESLVDVTYEKGAHYVLGTTEKVLFGDLGEFYLAFLNALNQGLCINDCVEYGLQAANYSIASTMDDPDAPPRPYTSFPLYTVGDGYQYIN